MMLSALFSSNKLTDSLDRSRFDSFCRQCVNLHYPQYGDGHFILACYAAFPAVMSPDLLNRLWLNFGAYKQYGQETRIHPVAVSDVLLSSLFNETGFELYEMPKTLRLFFLECWQNLPPQYKTEFDLHEPAEIAEFLTQYIDKERDKLDALTWEKQHYMALSYLNPQRLTYELAQKMKSTTIPRDKLRYARTVRDLQDNYKVFLAKEQQKIPYDFDKLSQTAAAQINILFNKTAAAEAIYGQMAQTGRVETAAKTRMVTIEVEEEIAVRIKVEKPKPAEKPRPSETGTKLFAVLVAIDKYPIAAHRLNGCINDSQALADYLKTYCEERGMRLDLYNVYDENASRQGVVESFKHFEAAKDGDVCLFHFVGHGSQMPTPIGMSEGVLSALVCWDSRMQPSGGRDLLSPEIAYLIHRATRNKDVHFLFISDAAHSGSITRSGGLEGRSLGGQTRSIARASRLRVEDLVGYQEWGSEQPPTGKHIHLASCADDETDKELQIDGKSRGAFLYSLIETLAQKGNNFISYAALMDSVQLKVRNRVQEQTPLLNYFGYSGEEMATLGFLGDKGNTKPSFLVGFDSTNGWILTGGGVQGIGANAVFELENEQVIHLDKVFGNYTTLKDFELEDKERQYRAALKKSDAGRSVCFAWQKESGTDDKAKDYLEGWHILKKTFEAGHWDGIILTEDVSTSDYSTKADYRIKVSDGSFQLLKIAEDTPLFKRVKRFEEASTHQFWNNCRAVARWKQILEIDNPMTSISTDALEIVFYDGNGQPVRDATYYQTEVGKPAIMRVAVTNKSSQSLWVSAVYFGSDFMISNEFVRHTKLNSEETVWLEYEGARYIPVGVQPEYLSQGITQLTEHFKIFVSTDFINTDIHNQNGLPLDGAADYGRQTASYGQSSSTFPNQDKTRAIRRATAPISNWRTYDCPFTIIFGKEETEESTPSVSQQKTSAYDSPEQAEYKTSTSPIKKQIKKK